MIKKTVLLTILIFITNNQVFAAEGWLATIKLLNQNAADQSYAKFKQDLAKSKRNKTNSNKKTTTSTASTNGKKTKFGYVVPNVSSFAEVQKLAKKGNKTAMYNLAVMYENGQDVAKSNTRAFDWYLQAANKGNIDSQYYVGVMYSAAKGIPLNSKKAVYWYTEAARKGNRLAQYNLAWMYDNGYGVRKSTRSAYIWFKKSAQTGYAPAQYNVGMIYKKGIGVRNNHNKAKYWFEKCAVQHWAQCQYQLGVLYYTGRGNMAVNDIVSYAWFSLALDNGYKKAQLGIDLLKKNMGFVDIYKAKFYNPIEGLGKPLPGDKIAKITKVAKVSKITKVSDVSNSSTSKSSNTNIVATENNSPSGNIQSGFVKELSDSNVVNVLNDLF